MWRPAHGATTRPGPCRPASGYGRELGRPGPRPSERSVPAWAACTFEPGWLDNALDDPLDTDAEAPAPITP